MTYQWIHNSPLRWQKAFSDSPLVDYLAVDANLSDAAPEHQTNHLQQHRDALHPTQCLAPASSRLKHINIFNY